MPSHNWSRARDPPHVSDLSMIEFLDRNLLRLETLLSEKLSEKQEDPAIPIYKQANNVKNQIEVLRVEEKTWDDKLRLAGEHLADVQASVNEKQRQLEATLQEQQKSRSQQKERIERTEKTVAERRSRNLSLESQCRPLLEQKNVASKALEVVITQERGIKEKTLALNDELSQQIRLANPTMVSARRRESLIQKNASLQQRVNEASMEIHQLKQLIEVYGKSLGRFETTSVARGTRSPRQRPVVK